MVIKKNKLLIIVLSSFFVSLVSFMSIGYLASSFLPYQDPPTELLKQYNAYLNTYTPILYTLVGVFSISFIIFIASLIKLFINYLKKDK